MKKENKKRYYMKFHNGCTTDKEHAPEALHVSMNKKEAIHDAKLIAEVLQVDVLVNWDDDETRFMVNSIGGYYENYRVRNLDDIKQHDSYGDKLFVNSRIKERPFEDKKCKRCGFPLHLLPTYLVKMKKRAPLIEPVAVVNEHYCIMCFEWMKKPLWRRLFKL